MIIIENVEVFGIYNALHSMRNSYNSWDKSDTKYEDENTLLVGEADYDLAMKLVKAGPSHRKFLRMIECYMDITAPLYWWKEFDTYKVGTVANSCSTMHTIANKSFNITDFSCEYLNAVDRCKCYVRATDGRRFLAPFDSASALNVTIEVLNNLRDKYLKTKDKNIWYQMIQLLPSSYNQKRTILLNYEVLNNIYKTRKDHKLDEWHQFCDRLKTLDLSSFITEEDAILC